MTNADKFVGIPCKMPQNCHECDVTGIFDLVGLECPATKDIRFFEFEKRPEKCPLRCFVCVESPKDSDVMRYVDTTGGGSLYCEKK